MDREGLTSITRACTNLDELVFLLNRIGFLHLNVSPVLPSLCGLCIPDANASQWWAELIDNRLAVSTKLVAGRSTLVSPEVFRLWATAYDGSVAFRKEADMQAGLMDRDAHHLLNVMLGRSPASTGQLRPRSGLEDRRFKCAMGKLQERGWIVAAGQDHSKIGSMISLLWTTADDWWGSSLPRPNRQERIQAWQEFVDQLAVACNTDPSRAERLLSWSPLADLGYSGQGIVT